ncbi:MAG: DUF6445 family protein [Sphingomonadales bacterium]|jgi:hypothetical protein
MHKSLLVVDDFLDNPFDLRNAALRLDYPHLQGAFPGRNSQSRIQVDGLDEEISHILGERVEPIFPLKSHGKCRISLEGDEGRGHVHIDHSYWSGILYLTLPEHCQGGTEFFRHLGTGMDRAPLSHEELKAAGLNSFDDIYTKIIEKEGKDMSKWEMTMTVPMRFNRLVLLRPWMWHTAGPSFGDNLENGRLVYLMFFRPVQR